MSFGVRPLTAALSCALVVFTGGCARTTRSGSDSKSPVGIAPADPWVLTSLDPRNASPALLWNGQIGVRIGPDGHGVGPMFVIDEYEMSGEEKIRPLPNPVMPVVDDSSNELLSVESGVFEQVRKYRQAFDMRTGVLGSEWDQADGDRAAPFHIRCETVLHPTRRILAQRWTVRAGRRINGAAGFSLPEGVKSLGSRVLAKDQDVVDAYAMPSGMRWKVRTRSITGPTIPAGAEGRSTEFVGEIIWSFGGRKANLPTAAREDPSFPPSYDEVAAAAKKKWAERWRTDIEIDGPVEDQQAVRSFLFYLRSAISREGKMSISPFGLSSSKYNGHVFWDADIWVFPALALVDPQASRAIASYRLETRPGAKKNAIDFQTPAKPHITELEPSILKTDFVKYAWESSVTGKETAPVAMRSEEHINGDVPWMLDQAASLGLAPADQAEQAVKDAAKYFYTRAMFPEELYIELNHVTSPDESHTGNNDLYTNLLAQWCANGGTWHPAPYSGDPINHPPPPHYKLPRDKASFLTYDDDPVTSYKQAAAVLSIYPLQYSEAERQAKTMMDRFAGKVSKNGPAMSDSLHALIWARIGETQKAYDAWRRSWQDFVAGPFLLFAEKRNRRDVYFTTGAAGSLQTVLYGFLGFRIESRKQDGAQWSVPLALGRVLSVKPNLPQSWKSVKFKGFTVLGRRYTLIATHKGVQVIQGDQ